ncbi:hypothetical protein [Aureivirga sp. CE67]|uniref:hypothetical protein n=1 Tax=Aureivirga sp. CE67 TaxID=1788983 RepID=UPI0018CAD2DE|nr:hypothetical protein [Aureivirga sp. CE67]
MFDKCLINEIGRIFWNKDNSESFFDDNIGFLGAFCKETDLIMISFFLKFKTKRETREFIEKYIEIEEDRFENLYREFNEEITLFYGCRCGDLNCGGIGAKIEKSTKFYNWVLGEGENSKIYRFETEQYQNEFLKYLNRSI